MKHYGDWQLDLKGEQTLGLAPPDWSVSSAMNDTRPNGQALFDAPAVVAKDYELPTAFESEEGRARRRGNALFEIMREREGGGWGQTSCCAAGSALETALPPGFTVPGPPASKEGFALTRGKVKSSASSSSRLQFPRRAAGTAAAEDRTESPITGSCASSLPSARISTESAAPMAPKGTMIASN